MRKIFICTNRLRCILCAIVPRKLGRQSWKRRLKNTQNHSAPLQLLTIQEPIVSYSISLQKAILIIAHSQMLSTTKRLSTKISKLFTKEYTKCWPITQDLKAIKRLVLSLFTSFIQQKNLQRFYIKILFPLQNRRIGIFLSK